MLEDVDPVETQEWRDALDSVLEFDGADLPLRDRRRPGMIRRWPCG